MKLMFLMPCHGRVLLTRVCLEQLVRTCRDAADYYIEAGAVIIADDENLDTADEFGFDVLRRSNEFLGQRWNDGYEYAALVCGATHVVPIGSDDWICLDWLVSASETPDRIVAPRFWTMVDEDGKHSAMMKMHHEGGLGVRVIPTEVLERVEYRPCPDRVTSGVDQRTFRTIKNAHSGQLAVRYQDVHPFQVIDWKGGDEQINSFRDAGVWQVEEERDVEWGRVAALYGPDGVEQMRGYYEGRARESVAA